MEARSGELVGGRYVLGRLIGEGGMGTVWQADDRVSGRQIALKLLRPVIAEDLDMRRRFLQEAQAVALIDHPNVIKIYDVVDDPGGQPALAMALLSGLTLGQLLGTAGSVAVEVALALITQVAAGVAAAHAHGIVHRDLKPDNIFVLEEGVVRRVTVLDFGIAKILSTQGSVYRTAPGAALGTPCYMAPEQAFGEQTVDRRADIWSIGAVFYEMLSGARPVEGVTVAQVIRHFRSSCITPIECLVPALPNDIATLVMSMLARDKADRPQSLQDVQQALAQHLE